MPTIPHPHLYHPPAPTWLWMNSPFFVLPKSGGLSLEPSSLLVNPIFVGKNTLKHFKKQHSWFNMFIVIHSVKPHLHHLLGKTHPPFSSFFRIRGTPRLRWRFAHPLPAGHLLPRGVGLGGLRRRHRGHAAEHAGVRAGALQRHLGAEVPAREHHVMWAMMAMDTECDHF